VRSESAAASLAADSGRIRCSPLCGLSLTLLVMALLLLPGPIPLPDVPADSSTLPHTSVAHASSGAVPNGDGTSNVSYWDAPAGQNDIFDTWLDSAAASSVNGGDATLTVGYDSATNARRTSLVGIDLGAVGFWTNATILSATLELNVRRAPTSDMTMVAWMPYPEWSDSGASWQSTGANGVDWVVGGALGLQDSGGVPLLADLTPNSTVLRLDATQTMRLAQARLATSGSADASLLITGVTAGVDCRFDSSEAAFWDMRPRWNVTLQWSSPSMPANVPSWLDIQPKSPIDLSADGQIVFKANVRNEDASISADTVSWSVDRGSIDSSGVYTPALAGAAVVTGSGTSSGVAATRDVTVSPGNAESLRIEPENATFTADDEVTFRAILSDAHGNSFDATAPQWWVDSGTVLANGSYQFNQTGTYRVDVLAGALSAWTNISIEAGAAASMIFPEDLTLPSGTRLQLMPSLFDSLGTPLNISRAGGLSWTAENGSIDAAGWFTGGAVGNWMVWCNGSVGVAGIASVQVTVGTLVRLEIIAPNGTVGADDSVPLPLIWHDEYGNAAITTVSIQHWSAEDGGFQMVDGQVEWLPRQSGSWNVEVRIGNISDSVEISVGHGQADRVYITTDSSVVSADDRVELLLEAEDTRGNRWPITGQWELDQADGDATLNQTEGGVLFEPVETGFWTIRAFTTVNGRTLESLKIIEVRPGRLSSISIEGQGLTITTDDDHDFAPVGRDAHGNHITGIEYNWTIDGVVATEMIRSADNVWNPSTTGDISIEVEAAGRAQRVTMYVTPGAPYSLDVTYDAGNSMRSGEMVEVSLSATDFDGNARQVDVYWIIPQGAAEVVSGERIGQYEVTGLKAGSWVLLARAEAAEIEVHISIEPGDPHHLEVHAPSAALKQRQLYEFVIVIYDIGGNEVSVDSNQISIDCAIAEGLHRSGNAWSVKITGSGDGIPMVVSVGDITSTVHLYAEPDALGFLTDTAAGRAASFSVVTAITFVILLLRLRRRGSSAPDRFTDDDGSAPKVRGDSAASPAGTAAVGMPLRHSRRGRRQAADEMHRPDQAQSVETSQMRQATANLMATGGGVWAPPSAPAAAAFTAADSAAAPIASAFAPAATGAVEAATSHTITVQPSPSDPTVQPFPSTTSTQPSTPTLAAAAPPVAPEAQTQPPRPATLDAPVVSPTSDVTAPASDPLTTGQPAPVVAAATTAAPPVAAQAAPESATVAAQQDDSTAASVARTGVLLACDGTVQGATGWYHDGEGETSYWQVDAESGWTRVE